MSTVNTFRSHGRAIVQGSQRGVVLIVALVALVALALASLAIFRSVDTGNLISGNMAFRQSALQASDVGVEAAFIALPTIVATSKDANIANQYYALRQTLDSNGFLPVSAWANVPCRDNTNAVVACSSQSYQVKYLIERMCDQQTAGSTTITDVQGYCYSMVSTGKSGTKKASAPVFSSVDSVYYRVTVQVTGPRNTSSTVQVLITQS